MEREEVEARPAGWLLRLVPPFLIGAFLRLWGLPAQVLVEDEVHALRSVLTQPWERLYRFQGRDHCLPLSALYRLLSDLGVGLSEAVLRAPSVAAGLLLLAVLPVAAGRRGGARTAAIYAWLLAFSPAFVYYSRIARPYTPAVLLSALAVAALWRWYRGAGHRWAALYVVAGGLALWLHLGFAPFLAAALLYGAVDRLRRRRLDRGPGEGRSLAALAVVAAGLAAAVLLIVVPVLEAFLRLLRSKQGAGEATAGVVLDVLRLESGSGHPAVTALFWAAVVAGLAVLLRRRPGFALFGLTLVAVQWIAVLGVVRPLGIDQPIVLARYVLVTLPVALLWVAYGLTAAGEAVSSRVARLPAWLVPAAAVALLAAGSSLAADPWLRLGPFAGVQAAVDVTAARRSLPPERVPAVYRLVAGAPGEGAVVEAVTTTVAAHLDATVALARFHRRPVVLAIDTPWLDDPRAALRTVIPAEPDHLCRAEARFVVLHRHWLELESVVDDLRGVRELPAGPGPREPEAETLRLSEGMVRECGEPYLAGEERWLWDLARRRVVTSGR